MTIKQLLKTAPVTTLLLVSFIGLFIMQVLTGVDANNPSTEALLNWGANALPLTMTDDPWRLVSSAFLHIGLMHLLFNGFAMYFFGQIAEPMFGSAKFLALFLLAAIGGNLLNNHVTWQGILDGTGQPGLSAGASGGIMGIGGALLIAALFKISVNGMVLNLRSLIFIMGINLVYGFAVPGIDNAGHIGGAITGLVIALAFAIAYRQRMAIALQNVPNIPIYQNRYQTDYPNDYQTSYIDHPASSDADVNNNDFNVGLNSGFNSDTYSDNGTYANSDRNINAAHANIIKQKTPAKPAFIWQLLPWIMMLLISIGFVWWWQDIHQQILQVLKTIE
ncbi:rhomboid family intramembrane serine protease [Psychrobacter sp. S1-30-MNA-CIBAN-0213]|uniref:rhomboid family intramembrane serine protease n=1 Tax=unclassified Psychrobacter TaxID=196806 RepID=UPI003322B86D